MAFVGSMSWKSMKEDRELGDAIVQAETKNFSEAKISVTVDSFWWAAHKSLKWQSKYQQKRPKKTLPVPQQLQRFRFSEFLPFVEYFFFFFEAFCLLCHANCVHSILRFLFTLTPTLCVDWEKSMNKVCIFSPLIKKSDWINTQQKKRATDDKKRAGFWNKKERRRQRRKMKIHYVIWLNATFVFFTSFVFFYIFHSISSINRNEVCMVYALAWLM